MPLPSFVRALPASGTLGASGTTNFSTSFDATGCSAIVVGVIIGVEAGNVTTKTITAITYNGVSLGTALVPKTMANGSNTAFFALYGLLNPASGSNTLSITTDLAADILNEITVVIGGYTDVLSFGNTAVRSDTSTNDSSTLNLNCSSLNTGVGFACHGSDITTVDQTLRGAVNNYSINTALNNAVLIESAGVGASTPFSANSSFPDFWGLAAVELVGQDTGLPTPSVFPIIEGTAETAVSTAGTNHAITLPGSISETDLVLVLMDIGSTSATINALTGWTEDLDEASANGLKILRYTGTGVPSNPTFVTSASTRSASIAYRISGADKSIAPQIGTTATGTSVSPDPPSVTPTGGIVKDYLFIAFAGMAGEEADDDTWANTPPTNYLPSPPLQKSCGTAGTNLGGLICAASRQLRTGSAENPGTFNVDASAAWRAQTIIIHPRSPLANARWGHLWK